MSISHSLIFPMLAENKHKWTTIIGILAGVALLSIIAVIVVVIFRRNKAYQISKKDSHVVSRRSIASRNISSMNLTLHKEYMEGNNP